MTDQSAITKLFQLAGQSFNKGDFSVSARLYEDIACHYESNASDFSEQDKASLFNSWGLALKRSGDLILAEQNYLKSNECSDFQVPCYLNNLAVCYFEMGDYCLSQQYYQKSIDILKSRGSNCLDLPLYQANLGTLLSYKGDFKNARKLFIESLEVFEQAGSRDYVTHSQFRLGHLLFQMGYFSDAIKFLTTAHRGNISIYSSNHPRTAEIMLLLSEVFQAQRELRKAETLVSKALLVFKKTLDPNAPQTGRCYMRLAEIGCLRGLAHGDLRIHLKKAYMIFRKALPNELNLDMADYYALRGEVLMYEKKYHRAICYLSKSLRIRQGLFEPVHPALAMNYNHIGYCYAQLKQVSQAKKAYIQSIHIFKRIHRCHSWLPLLLCNIAELYKGKLLRDVCMNYGWKIVDEKPNLLKDANLEELHQPVNLLSETPKPEILPEIKIFLIATPDMKFLAKAMTEKISAMISFYQGELPELSLCVYIQDSEESNEAFEKIMREEPESSFHKAFICLIGKEYGSVVNLRPETLKRCPWSTNYRDRASWEIILRNCILSGMTGTVYYFPEKVSKVDIQNPYLRNQCLLQELQLNNMLPQSEIKTIHKTDPCNTGDITHRLNLAVLQARKRYVKESFNVNVSL